MGKYSHSKLSAFEHCKLKYKFKYIDKIKPEIEKTIEIHLGEVVHETLEWIYRKVIENQIPSLDNTLNFFAEKWQEKYIPEILIVKKEMTEKDYFSKGVQFILDYYMKHQPFDDNTLELEKKIILKLGEHEIIGFIDRLAFNKKTEEFEIHDYKTSNTIPSREKIESDRQLALYSIAIKEIFGEEKKICLIWHYLNFDEKICSRRTKEQLEELKKEIVSVINKIESEKEFPYNKSPLCNWCEYKNICPAFPNSARQKTL
ncbi:MAG: PD-(D/E)XK nuclease family protein [Candidatus Pacearchaeota archaeon]